MFDSYFKNGFNPKNNDPELKCLINKNIYLKPECKKFFLNQISPLFHTIGSWLIGVSSIKYSGKSYGAILLKQHINYVKSDTDRLSTVEQFNKILIHEEILLKDIGEYESYCKNKEDYSIGLPNFLLTLSYFPTDFFFETLGANLAITSYLNSLSNIEFLSVNYSNNTIDYAKTALQEVPQKEEDTLKVKLGYSLCIQMIREFEKHLNQNLEDDIFFSSNNKVLKILEKIGPYGCGYHKKGTINEKTIDSYLTPENFNSTTLLQDLGNSKYIRPGHPESSAFLNMIKNPKGTMFGIFSEGEIQEISDWIKSLDKDLKFESFKPPSRFKGSNLNFEALNKKENYIDKTKSIRELYYIFLNIDIFPEYIDLAQQTAKRWLQEHSYHSDPPFKKYTHKKFKSWLLQKHTAQVNSYTPLKNNEIPEVTKEEVIYDAIQLAPLTLIDGAWLRSCIRPGYINNFIEKRLYNTFIDELGYGDILIHHGNIYRDLLHSMGLDIPDFSSKEFTELKIFEDSSFEVPTFWLSISLFPKTFFPEILGLNLAMELSGIGGEYRKSGDILKYYGFSNLFTRLHNTIDNIVTGHTAWASEAITNYLDYISQHGDSALLDQAWERIWLGYESLNPPKRNSKTHIKNLFNKILESVH